MNAIDLLLDPSRMGDAVSKIAALMASAKEPLPNEQHEVRDFPARTSFGELLEEYDYGEPLWNGWLMLLTKHLLVPRPTTIHVSSIEDLAGVKSPCLIGEWESVESWDSSNVGHRIDLDDDKMESLAKLLDVTVEPDEEHAFMVVLRALDAVRTA